MHLLLVVNPIASSVDPASREAVRAALGARHRLEEVETTGRHHATDLARAAVAEGVDAVVVLAGDGTLNEAANGLAGSAVALATLPGGSTNVFGRALGLPRHPGAAASSVVASLEAGAVRASGLGSVDGRLFLFHVGMGFDAEVVREVERNAPRKRAFGQGVFLLAAARTWARQARRPDLPFAVAFADGSSWEGVRFVVVLNVDPYTYLGPRPIVMDPRASLTSPLSVVGFRSVGLATMAPAIARALRGHEPGGRPVRSGQLVVRHEVASLEVVGTGPVAGQVDGDDLGDALRREVLHVPEAVRIVVPL